MNSKVSGFQTKVISHELYEVVWKSTKDLGFSKAKITYRQL